MIIKTSYPFMKPPPSARLIRGHRLSQDLVGAWTMAENGGFQVFDLSGNGRTGTFGAGTASPIWVSGKFGLCPSFDGGDYIEIDETYYDSGTHSQITVSIWTYSTGYSINEVIIGRNFAPFNIQITSVSGGNANFKTSVRTDVTGYIQPTTTDNPLTKNVWHNIVLRYDGTTCKAFLDGIEVRNVNGTGNLFTGDQTLSIGSDRNIQYYFTGKLDVPTIYNRALSASEIAELNFKPFGMFERKARTALMSGYEVVAPPIGMAGAMTTNTGYWGY